MIPFCSTVIFCCDRHYTIKGCPKPDDDHHLKARRGTQPFFPLVICNHISSISFTLNKLLFIRLPSCSVIWTTFKLSVSFFLIFSFILFYKRRKTTKYAVALKISTGGSEETVCFSPANTEFLIGCLAATKDHLGTNNNTALQFSNEGKFCNDALEIGCSQSFYLYTHLKRKVFQILWCLGTWLSAGLGSIWLIVGFGDLKGLFQAKWFYDSMSWEEKLKP